MSRQPKINSQFVPRRPEMLRSPAFRALSLTGHRILARIEIEHCHHGGKDNGKLPVTYEDFHRYGVHHHAIGPGLRETEALGLVEITQRGLAGNADHKRPNFFRLTYLPTGDGKLATDEWCRIETVAEAETIVAKARADKPSGYPRRSRQIRNSPMPGNSIGNENSQCRKTQKPMP
jgi:hypothetical protein